MRTARVVLGTAAILVLSAPLAGAQVRAATAQQREDAAARAVVEAAAGRAAAAFNRGDMAGMVRDYVDDVWVFPPNAQPYQGAQGLLDYHARAFRQQGVRNLQLATTGFERSGNLAYETGTYSVDVPLGDRAGTVERRFGKYIQIWKRGGTGEWRIHHVMWSPNLPPAPVTR